MFSFHTQHLNSKISRCAPTLHSSPAQPHGDFSATQIEEATRLWVERVVIRHSLCPWASGVHSTGKLKILTAEPRKKDTILSYRKRVLKEAKALLNLPQSQLDNTTEANVENIKYESTMVILPRGLDDFLDYLDFIAVVEEDLSRAGLTDFVQVATFHPQFMFVQSQPTDPENFTNRSPFPIAHLLRESDVSAAVDSFDGETDVIWKRNEETMRRIGLQQAEASLESILYDAIENASS